MPNSLNSESKEKQNETLNAQSKEAKVAKCLFGITVENRDFHGSAFNCRVLLKNCLLFGKHASSEMLIKLVTIVFKKCKSYLCLRIIVQKRMKIIAIFFPNNIIFLIGKIINIDFSK